MDEIAPSAPPAQRDDGHGGDSGGQRRRGDAFLILSGVRDSNIAFVINLNYLLRHRDDYRICIGEAVVVGDS